MAKNDSRLLSGRVKTKSGTSLDTRRSDFLSLDNAEPNFGNPDSDRYVLASLADGTRLFLNLNNGFIVNADSVSGDETTFSIDPSGLANADGTTLSEVLDDLDASITLALNSLDSSGIKSLFSAEGNISYNSSLGRFSTPASGVVSGTYGAANKIPVISVDSFGQVDSIGLVTPTTSLGDTVDSMSYNSLNGIITLTTDVASFPVQLGLAPFDTDSLSEGTTNLYYTNARVDSAILSKVDSDYVRLRADSDYIKSVTGIDADTLDGINSASFLRSDVADQKTTGNLRFNDNIKLTFGQSDDLQLYHDGTNSFISEVGTGDLYITTNGQEVLIKDSQSGKLSAEFIPDSAVDLYYNNSKKFNTTNTGVDITGNVVADGGTIDGQLFVNYSSTSNPAILITSTDANTQASPELELYKNSTSASGHYLGQLKFTGENSTGGKKTYAKITGKILDNTNGSEDGIIEIAFQKAGSNNIAARFRSDRLDLINGTALNVNGDIYTDNDLSANNITRRNTTVTAGTYGSGSAIPVITVDGSGFVDSAGTITVATVLNTVAETGTGSINLLDSALEIAAGVGIDTTASGNTVTVEIDSADLAAYFSKVIVHDNTNGFVADEHIAHSSVSITAGNGLTGGGNIASSRTLNVVGGDGITANANEIEVTVDNSTIELSATDRSGAVRVKDGGITNAKLQYDSSTIGTTSIVLGGSTTTLAGLTQLDVDNIRIDGNTISSTSSGNMFIDPHPQDSAGTLVILGDLQINGTTTTINSVNLSISDKNIVLADSAANAAQATGAGITVGTYASNPTITYDGATDRWDFNRSIEVTGSITVDGDITFSDSDDLILPDNSKIKMGTSADLEIYHDGSNSFIAETGTGLLQLRTNGPRIEMVGQSGAEYMARFEQDGPVKLFHNALQKFATTSTGVDVTGDITVDGNINFSDSDNIVMPDKSKIKMGTGSDLEIYHDGSHSYVDDRGTGDLRLRGNGSVKIMQYNNSELMAAFKVDSSVELYHNGLKKFDTTSTGIDVTGSITTDSATISGNLTTATVDINGGFIDGTAIGHTTADSATFTNLTANNLTIDTNTLFVDAANNRVGIGTDNTIKKLRVVDATDATTDFRTTNGTDRGFEIKLTSAASEVTIGSSTNHPLALMTNDTEAMRIDASGNVGIGTTSPAATLDVNGHMAIDTNSGQISDGNQAAIATFTAATFSGAKLVVTAKDGSNRYISELLITHNGTTAVATEYGQVATSSALATYDVDINGGNVRLLATPASTNATTFKVMKLLLID